MTKSLFKRHVKFLGVYLDENLSWKIHINYISKKYQNLLE